MDKIDKLIEAELKESGRFNTTKEGLLVVQDEDGYDWYVYPIDSTHVRTGITPKDAKDVGGMNTYPIDQLRDRPYYDEIKDFLRYLVNADFFKYRR